MTLLRVVGLALCALLAFVGATVAQDNSADPLTSQLETLCADQIDLCRDILGSPQSAAAAPNWEACAVDPCGKDCHLAPVAKCVGLADLTPEVMDCFNAYPNCFLAEGDEVLPWPWALADPDEVLPWPMARAPQAYVLMSPGDWGSSGRTMLVPLGHSGVAAAFMQGMVPPAYNTHARPRIRPWGEVIAEYLERQK